ncbi:MAG: hypothetical protein K8U03_16840 [Planctomycetia bacterium]|nr:hypothetical protein [Planctomycetia bacterium]
MKLFRSIRAVASLAILGGAVLGSSSSSTFGADEVKPPIQTKAAEKPAGEKTDRERIIGTWIVARLGGGSLPERKPAEGDSITLTIENEQFKAIVINDGNTQEVVGSFSLVAEETPKLLDAVVQNGDKAMSVYALYELEEKVLKIRFNAATGERPADFKTPVEGGMTLIFHRKIK